MNQAQIYLQKRLNVLVPKEGKAENRELALTINKNLESLGFALSRQTILALSKHSEEWLAKFYAGLVADLKEIKGAHVIWKPMYPNFPTQVLEMDDLEMYWNAIFHYITLESPNMEPAEARLPLPKTEGNITVVDLGKEADYQSILTELAGANASLSATDKEILTFMLTSEEDAASLLPAVIPQRETLALIGAVALEKDKAADLTKIARTATDVLRVATQLSKGDVSLAEKATYANFGRPTRRALLTALEACGPNLEEDMDRHRSKWVRLGEKLHPGQYAKAFPRTAAAFIKLRNNVAIDSLNSKVEKAIIAKDWKKAAELLSERPGDFLRRLDHVLRASDSNKALLAAFGKVAGACATPALLNAHHHFLNRKAGEPRAVFPKGQTAKMKVIPASAVPLSAWASKQAAAIIEGALKERFAKLPAMGKVYIDPDLANYPIPAAQRSASKTLRALPRGSHAPIQGEGDTLRFFIHWKNAGKGWNGRVDLDLSAALLGEDFTLVSQVAYYNLKEFGATHSGDITDAPDGAAEFIDVDMAKIKKLGARYVAATVTSFTNQPYRELPECFCGWMIRNKEKQGEIFEARTVETKSDLCGDTRFVIPVIIDIEKRKAIWCDLGLKSNTSFPVALEPNKRSLSLTCKTIAALNKPNLHTLLRLHASARGEIVEIPSQADTVFGEEFAYENDTITNSFLANAVKGHAEPTQKPKNPGKKPVETGPTI